MKKGKSVIKNYIYNLLYEIIRLVLPIVTTPYISRILGASNIGIYSYTLSISAYFITLGSLGTALYGQREIAFHQNNKEEYTKNFLEILLLRMILIAISLVIFILFFVVRDNDYNVYFLILIIEIIGSILDISWFFSGLEEFKKIAGRNLLIKFISIVLIFTFVKTKNDINIYFYIYVLSVLIGNLSLWLYLPKYLIRIKRRDISLRKHLKPALQLFIPQIAIQIYTLLDKTMIGVLILDKSEVGYYDQSQKIIKMLLTIVTSLGTVMLPRIANTFAEGNKQKIKDYMYDSFNCVLILSIPLITGVVLISNRFVPIFFGDGYEPVILIMKIISPILLIIGISNVIGTQYLLPTKRQKEFTISVVIGAIVNFIINIFAIMKFGAIGASISTIIAELCVTSIQLYFVRKEFDLIDIFMKIWKYIFSSIVMFVICYFVSKFISNDVFIIVVQIFLGCTVYFLMLIILKDKFLDKIIKKLLMRGKI